MKLKALFFDIDGTLVGFRTHKMTDSLKECLYELRAKGVKLFISSGRHVLVMNNLDGFPFDGYIAMNGALTILDGEVIDQHPLPRDVSVRITEFADDLGVPCLVFADDLYGVNFENSRSKEISRMVDMSYGPLLDLRKVAMEHVVYQYTLFVTEDQEREYLRPVLKGVDYPRWHPYFADIVPAGLSKSYGASMILERIGAGPEDCMAFGDGGNDIPLIEYAGTGVAMGNAPDEVKAAADYVTDSVDDDGVITALRHFGIV